MFFDIALSDPMGANFLLWTWRMIYVTQNSKIFPNIQKNAAVTYINSNSLRVVDERLVRSADLQALNFDINTFNARHKNCV